MPHQIQRKDIHIMDKKALISAIHRVTNTSLGNEKFSISGTNDLLVLITAAGQITGTPLQVIDESSPKAYISDKLFSTVANFFAEKEDDSFLLLKDAVLKTLGYDITYQYLYVFTDDIIAVTVTKSDVN